MNVFDCHTDSIILIIKYPVKPAVTLEYQAKVVSSFLVVDTLQYGRRSFVKPTTVWDHWWLICIGQCMHYSLQFICCFSMCGF